MMTLLVLFTGLFALVVLAAAISAIYTDLTYKRPKGFKRNPLFAYVNKKRAKRKGRKA